MSLLTVAVCTYNRAARLPALINALSSLESPVPIEIIVIDNNSTDGTRQVVEKLTGSVGVPLRYFKETRQGIVHARNCAIENSGGSKLLAFIDDDELPGPGWLKAAVDALDREGADCAGGEISINLPLNKRLDWLEDELLGFFGKLNYGQQPFWISDRNTPVWSGNIAYRTSLFADGLRFDERYNREGNGIGGGEDAIMFQRLLDEKRRIRYRPDMVIKHFVDEWKLKRRYFLNLHFKAGRRYGRYQACEYESTIMGVPPFMLSQVLRQWGRTLLKLIRLDSGMLRQAMNGAHAAGVVIGRIQRWKERNKGMVGEMPES